jgi:hypothetical protein
MRQIRVVKRKSTVKVDSELDVRTPSGRPLPW